MLDQVTPEMKKLGEGALPDGGFYPVSLMMLLSSLSVILIIAVFNNQIDIYHLIISNDEDFFFLHSSGCGSVMIVNISKPFRGVY